MLEITSLDDKDRKFIPEQCDTCANNGKGADRCKINADGKCNYEEVIPGFRCHECVYATEHYDSHSKSYSYDCSIGKFFNHCKSFLQKSPLMQFPPETVSAKEIINEFNSHGLAECAKCIYAVKESDPEDNRIVRVHCKIGKSFLSCDSFMDSSKVSNMYMPYQRFVPDLNISDDTTVEAAEEPERMTHRIKILESFADAVFRGDKTFEVRKNDRGYQKGDRVEFTVVDSDGIEQRGHPLYGKRYVITYVLAGWGIQDGYVVFGIRE